MKSLTALLLLLASLPLMAQEAIVTLGSTVTGSQDQPKVMYIVPWQQPGEARFDYAMQGSFADELFEPIDRDEFVRGLNYQAMLDDVAAGDTGEEE
jgi:hypothetical protein